MLNSRKAVDASTSNAGDDFHLLWAVRRCFELLKPGTELTAVKPEGITPVDAAEIDSTGHALLSVDLTEYFGGLDFGSSATVRYSQLKYSTTNPSAPWTIAATTAGKKTGSAAGSLIRRFADTFKKHCETFGRELVIGKLQIRLVSNRPICNKLSKALFAAQEKLANESVPNTASLLKLLELEDRRVIQQMFKASALGSLNFCDFLQVLDLSSNTSELSRARQEIEVAKNLGNLGFYETRDQRALLKSRIWDLSLPNETLSITRDEMVAMLHGGMYAAIFPSTSSINSGDKLVEREQAMEIARIIESGPASLICVHGGGGYGKTTLLGSIVQQLPEHSISVIFDCFAAGKYRNPEDCRHLHENGIRQIINELAVATNSDILLNRDASRNELIRRFCDKLRVVSEVAKASNPRALVCVFVDAADNSVSAALERGDVSFVTDIVQCEIPAGCRVILTCRSHQMDVLGLKADALCLPINPFTETETEANLALHFEGLSRSQIKEFHELTNGVPRVQAYALGLRDRGFDAILDVLRPTGKVLDEIFEQAIRDSGLRNGDQALVDRVCGAVANLYAPAPLEMVGKLAGASFEAVMDVCSDLSQGIYVASGAANLRDEDLEKYLQRKYPLSAEAKVQRARLLQTEAGVSEYASRNLGRALASAGLRTDLLDLVERPIGLDVIPDPIERRQIQISRIRNAMQLVRNEELSAVHFQLLFALSRESKAHKSTDQVLDEHPDLALQHGTPGTIQRLYFSDRSEGAGDQASRHMCCAGVYARRDGDTATVREHQRLAEIALREWARLDQEQREEDPVDNHYIAMLVESYVRCDGYDKARQWLKRWQPRHFRLDVCKRVARNLFQFGLVELDTSGDNFQIELDATLAYAEASIEACKPINDDLTQSISNFLPTIRKRARSTEHRQQFLTSVIASAEACARASKHCLEWADVLDAYSPRPPQVDPQHTYGNNAEGLETYLRYLCLHSVLLQKELSPKDPRLVPQRLRQTRSPLPPNATDEERARRREDDERQSQQRKAHLAVCEFLLPAIQFRALALAGNLERSGYMERLEAALRATAPSTSSYWFAQPSNLWKSRRAKLLCQTILLTSSSIKDDFGKVISSFPDPWPELRIDLAEIAAAEPALHLGAMTLVKDAYEQIQEVAMPGTERIQLLVRCCKVANSVDRKAGHFYFERTLEAAEEVDEEAFSIIRLLVAVAQCKDTLAPKSHSPKQAESLASLIEDYSVRFDGHDYFPWTEAIRGLTHLSPAVATAMVCRWDLAARLGIGESIPDLLEALLARNAADPRFVVATSLLPGNQNQSSLGVSLQGLIKLRGRNPRHFQAGLRELADYCVRGCTFEERIGLSREYCNWISEHGMTASQVSKSLSELIEFHSQEDVNDTSQRAPSVTIPTFDPNDDEPAPPTIPLVGTFGDLESIENPLRQLAAQASNQHVSWNLYSERLKLLQRMIPLVPISSYIDHLNAVIEVSPQLVPFDQVVSVVCDRLEQWKAHPAVASWAKEAPRRIARRAIESLFAEHGYRSYAVEKLLGLAKMERSEFAILLLRSLPESEQIAQMGARAVHEFTLELATKIDPPTADAVLQWMLDKLMPHVRSENAAAEVSTSVERVAGRSLTAGLTWFLLGHPDTRIRWRTIHACRTMHRLGHTIAQELAEWLVDGQSHPMCPSNKPFYWLAARQSYFLLLERLASETPDSMLPLLNLIVGELKHSPFPHVIVQRSCSRAIQEIAKSLPQSIPDSDLALAKSRLDGRIASERKRGRRHGLGVPWQSKHSHCFDFDQMDTVSYWYEPLAEVFDLSAEDFFPVIEGIICQDWGLNGNLRDHDCAKTMYPNDSYTLFSNRQGSTPIVEDFHHHVELHAMFCAAMQFLDSHEIQLDFYSDGEVNRWESWLARWDLSIPPLWIADQRQATPLQHSLWAEPAAAEWLKAPTDDEFDRATGFIDCLHPGFLQVWGSTDLFTSKASRDYRVRSALVAPDTAEALMRTFQSSHALSFRIPAEGDEDAEIHECIGELKLELRGWICDEHIERNSLEEADPYAYRMDPAGLRPGQEASAYFNLGFDNLTGEFSQRNDSTNRIALREVWCDKPDRVDREHYVFFSEGKRLWFSIRQLLNFLKATQVSLIIETQIARRVNKGRLEDSIDDEEQRGKHDWKSRIYIIDCTGKVSTVSGCHLIGQAP